MDRPITFTRIRAATVPDAPIRGVQPVVRGHRRANSASGSEWVVPTSVLKDRRAPSVAESPNPVGRDVPVLRPSVITTINSSVSTWTECSLPSSGPPSSTAAFASLPA